MPHKRHASRLVQLLLALCLPLLALNAQEEPSSEPDPEPRITKRSLDEEQRIIEVHLREARKDLDRAKLDINGGRLRTAGVILARTEVSVSEAGGLLEAHPVRIEKLRGLFVGESAREALRETFEELDHEYLNLEREFFTMIDEVGGSSSSRDRLAFLKLLAAAMPTLKSSDAQLASQFEQLLNEYVACLEAGDDDCARNKLQALRELYESRKSEVTEATGRQVATDNIIQMGSQDWPAIVRSLPSEAAAAANELQTVLQRISDPSKRANAEALYTEYLQALQRGDTAKARELESRIRALAPQPSPSPSPVSEQSSNTVVVNAGKITFLDANGRPIVSADENTIRAGKNTVPQAEYAGGLGKRLTKEFDIIIDYDPSTQSFQAEQANVKIWSLEVAEIPSERSLDATLITSFELKNDGRVGSDYTVENWSMVDESGTVLREGSGSAFRVEFSRPGTYRIFAKGTTERDNAFEIGREYPIAESILE